MDLCIWIFKVLRFYHLRKNKLSIWVFLKGRDHRIQHILNARCLQKNNQTENKSFKVEAFLNVMNAHNIWSGYDSNYPNTVVGAHIVLINGLQPTNIIVGVWNQVNIEFPLHNTTPSVVLCVFTTNKCAMETEQEKKGKSRERRPCTQIPCVSHFQCPKCADAVDILYAIHYSIII